MVKASAFLRDVQSALCGHIYAYFWHYISFLEVQNHDTDTWFVDGEIPIFYILGFDNNGYSGLCGIVPQNRVEVGFCSFTILSGSMVFGYCLNGTLK